MCADHTGTRRRQHGRDRRVLDGRDVHQQGIVTHVWTHLANDAIGRVDGHTNHHDVCLGGGTGCGERRVAVDDEHAMAHVAEQSREQRAHLAVSTDECNRARRRVEWDLRPQSRLQIATGAQQHAENRFDLADRQSEVARARTPIGDHVAFALRITNTNAMLPLVRRDVGHKCHAARHDLQQLPIERVDRRAQRGERARRRPHQRRRGPHRARCTVKDSSSRTRSRWPVAPHRRCPLWRAPSDRSRLPCRVPHRPLRCSRTRTSNHC